MSWPPALSESSSLVAALVIGVAFGFVLEDLVEVRPPYGAKPRFDFASLEWARRWPRAEI